MIGGLSRKLVNKMDNFNNNLMFITQILKKISILLTESDQYEK